MFVNFVSESHGEEVGSPAVVESCKDMTQKWAKGVLSVVNTTAINDSRFFVGRQRVTENSFMYYTYIFNNLIFIDFVSENLHIVYEYLCADVGSEQMLVICCCVCEGQIALFGRAAQWFVGNCESRTQWMESIRELLKTCFKKIVNFVSESQEWR